MSGKRIKKGIDLDEVECKKEIKMKIFLGKVVNLHQFFVCVSFALMENLAFLFFTSFHKVTLFNILFQCSSIYLYIYCIPMKINILTCEVALVMRPNRMVHMFFLQSIPSFPRMSFFLLAVCEYHKDMMPPLDNVDYMHLATLY